MRGPIKQHANSMQRCQCRKIQSILALSREIDVYLIEDAVTEISLLVQRSLNCITFSLREE